MAGKILFIVIDQLRGDCVHGALADAMKAGARGTQALPYAAA